MIDISDIDDKSLVLLYLYKFAQFGAIEKNKEIKHFSAIASNLITLKHTRRKKAKEYIEQGLYFYDVDLGNQSRPLNVNLSRSLVDDTAYNSMHGDNQAEKAMQALRAKLAKQAESVEKPRPKLEEYETVTLYNGALVSEKEYIRTLETLKALSRNTLGLGWMSTVFFQEIVFKCRDPNYESLCHMQSLIDYSNGILNEKGLVASDSIKQIVLAATEGDGANLHLVDPENQRKRRLKL